MPPSLDKFTTAVAAMLTPPYRLALLVPIAVLSFVILLVCAFLIICCRIKSQPKTTKTPLGISVKGGKTKKKSLSQERPEVSGPLSSPNSKNTPKNGSATDSGVFTLDSSHLATAQKSPGKNSGSSGRSANFSSHEAGVDVWAAGDEGYHGYHGEAFLAEAVYPVAGHAAYYDGANGHAHVVEAGYDEQEDDEAYASGGRRVLREIIV